MENFLYEENDGIGVLTVSREKVLNALNTELIVEGSAFIDSLSDSESLKVLIITGAGSKSFVAGADISGLNTAGTEEGRKNALLGREFFQKIEDFHVPVIAAINGFALGGGLELALSCDFRYASTKAKLGLPEVGLGLIPGYGGTQRLSRLIGIGKAKEYVFTGDMIRAEQALTDGLVNKLIEPEALLEETLKVAKLIASRGPLAIKAAKRAMNVGIQLDLQSALNVETLEFSYVCGTKDKTEGTSAFLEKRQANFSGN
ncbi:MAG: enoyl-CoA hydratase/isomerase family protein [Candidatus Cloacimonetes bacterium]|nr:enoyl-CoA hydratase/isomerase family protein [Candidatus Cloacimonadota bacterium]